MTHRFRLLVLLALAAIALPSCSTLDYRSLQSEFESAVRIDNERSVSPFTDAAADYGAVLAKLDDAYIGTLDARLQPNAWMLRGVCAWRSGDAKQTREASKNGLALKPEKGTRDDVVLHLLPGLAFAAEAVTSWRTGGQTVDDLQGKDGKRGLQEDLVVAWGELVKAEGRLIATSPPAVASYVHYQKWRVANDWAQMINEATRTGPDRMRLRQTLNAFAKSTVGADTLGQAASAAKAKVKGPLRQLIDVLGR